MKQSEPPKAGIEDKTDNASTSRKMTSRVRSKKSSVSSSEGITFSGGIGLITGLSEKNNWGSQCLLTLSIYRSLVKGLFKFL